MFILSQNLRWTDHSRIKMRQYQLSESRVKRVLRHPKRVETGIAPNTIAGMQLGGSKNNPYEIWVMWAKKIKNGGGIIIISAWKYPGISPIGEPPLIPDEVWDVINKFEK